MAFSRYNVMHSKSTKRNTTQKPHKTLIQISSSGRMSSNNNNKSHAFPMKPEHFSDYGFDPHFDYFQVLEEARNRQTEDLTRSIDSIRLKLHKPTTTTTTTTATSPATPFYNNHHTNSQKKKKRGWWWCNKVFKFFRCTTNQHTHMVHNNMEDESDVHFARARDFRSADSSVSGPLYMTETSPHYGIHPGLMSPATTSGCSSPYLSLRELNVERQNFRRMTVSASASPIYLVT